MKTLHIVSHTHWDREWFETYQQFRLKLVRMVDDLLHLLETDPAYRHFMLDGQMIVLEDYLAVRPEREDDLRRWIAAGRIVVGPWYILPDEFLVSPEATLRNLYEGDRVARRFGPRMPIGYLPDTFGHIGQMPQILLGYGLDKACAWRGIDDLPCEFWWQAPDGTRVLMSNLRESYSNARHLTGAPLERFVDEVRRLRETLTPHAPSGHLLLMNGDDFMAPQPALGQAVVACGGQIDNDVLLHSTLPAYFAGVEAALDPAALPVVTGELRATRRSNLLPNVLSTRIWIKQRNHTCETLLEKWAEPFSAWAALAAAGDRTVPLLQRPCGVLRQAWRLLLECHPHDSICGCSIDPVHTEMQPRFDQVDQIAAELTRQSLQTLAGAIETLTSIPGVVSAVVVFNPSTAPRSDVASAALTGLKPGQPFRLLDGERPVPYQVDAWEREVLSDMMLPPEHMQALLDEVNNGEIQGFRILETEVESARAEAHVTLVISDHGRPNLPAWERGRSQVQALLAQGQTTVFHVEATRPVLAHVTFPVESVPGLGYKTLHVQPGASESSQAQVDQERALPPGQMMCIENEALRATLQPDGTLDVIDLRNGACYAALHRFEDTGDRGDEYSYSPSEDGAVFRPVLQEARILTGPFHQSLEVDLLLEIPARLDPERKTRSTDCVLIPIHSRITLHHGVPRLEFHTEIHNQAEDHRLRVHFPAPLKAVAALHDGHFEIVERPIGVPPCPECFEQPRPEVPQRAFTAIQDERIGLLVANRGLPEVEALQNTAGNAEIALTLLRCVGWLSRSDFPERGGHAGPGLPTPGAQMPGRWAFDYAVVPFAAGGLLAAAQQASAFQAPLRAASTGLHPGRLPQCASLLQVEPQSFLVSAVKAAEEGDGLIVRGYNPARETLQVRLSPLLSFGSAWRVNLAEQPLDRLPAAADGSVELTVQGGEIATVRFYVKGALS